MLIGMVLVANPRKITLRAMEIITKTKEIVILNPSQYFIPTAQNISNIYDIKISNIINICNYC